MVDPVQNVGAEVPCLSGLVATLAHSTQCGDPCVVSESPAAVHDDGYEHTAEAMHTRLDSLPIPPCRRPHQCLKTLTRMGVYREHFEEHNRHNRKMHATNTLSQT